MILMMGPIVRKLNLCLHQSETSNVFGQSREGIHADTEAEYDPGRYRNFERPTERQHIAPIG